MKDVMVMVMGADGGGDGDNKPGLDWRVWYMSLAASTYNPGTPCPVVTVAMNSLTTHTIADHHMMLMTMM